MANSHRKLMALSAACFSVILALAVVGCPQGTDGGKGAGTPAVEQPKQTVSEKVKVEFFIMSQCPFGVQVVDGIAPALKKFGGDVEFHIDFIGDEKDGKLTSMHGDNEVKGDIVQLCAIKIHPVGYLDMFTCMNKNARAIPGNWEDCAKSAGLKVDEIRTCYEGNEGQQLLKASFDRSKNRRARGSPTMFLNDKPYNGGRTDAAFTRAICDGFPKEKPQLCASLPPPIKVPITIVTDSRCKDCRADMWKGRLESMFPGAEVTILDYTQEDGKKKYEELQLELLPAILFGQEVSQAENYNRISRFLSKKGEYLEFRAGARHNPTKEICDNQVDDTNNGKIDCADPDCTNDLVCRKEIAKKLEVFVMSQCPFGVKALDAMPEVLKNFNNGIQFEVHYIADEEGDGFRSLHGQPEVDENIRELCAMKYYPKNYKYMDYIGCRDKNIRSAEWKSCTGENGIDAAKIEKCATGDEGKKLLREDLKLAKQLGVSASPTWLANNKYKFSGIDAETIKTQLCRYNKDMPNCDKKLSGPEKGKPPAGACK